MNQASGPLDITILGVQPLYQGCSGSIKEHPLQVSGALTLKLLMCSHVGLPGNLGLRHDLVKRRNDFVWADNGDIF